MMRERGTIATALHLIGHFDTEAFRCFAEGRARLLSLDMRTERLEATDIVFVVKGAQPLVGMFVMACLVGPVGCLVNDWTEGYRR
ncbi:hypothetical protein [Asaia bogorensis]|uniref:hypothetical protein n=1 Tax=Asaia bogorensis TaxID=91915 RepID=UPI002865A708|nr:hypothetical protein [Asaia bogorensis]MDR6182238.1 hypothetical protein [Asaia bogorensis NBRC 16594]